MTRTSDLEEIHFRHQLGTWRVDTMVGMTKGKFGFLQGGGEHEPGPAAPYVQIYVKSSALSRAPDLAISVLSLIHT